jgi:hypothetical protein
MPTPSEDFSIDVRSTALEERDPEEPLSAARS